MAESSEAFAAAGVSAEAATFFSPEIAAAAYVEKLSGAELFSDALQFTAQTLAPLQCATWSLSCLRELQKDVPEVALHALAAVHRWIGEPSDVNRRACKSAAEAAGLKTAAGCLAMAAFFAEGSIAPAERDKVPVPPRLSQKLAGSALILAIVEDPKAAAARYRQCLLLASQTV